MAWTLVGRIAQAAAQAGLLVLLARLGSAQMVGELALALALCSPLMVIAGLQQRVVYVTDVKRRFTWSTHVRLRRGASAVALVVACLIAAGGLVRVPVWTVAAIALAKSGDLAGDLHHATFQSNSAMWLYARSVALRAAVGLAGLFIVLSTTGSLAGGLFAMALVSWAVALFHDTPPSRRLRPQENSKTTTATRLLWTAAPLGLVAFVDSVTQQAVRIQVDALLGTAALGHYAAMSYVVVAGGAVVFALGTPLLPRMASHYTAGKHRAFARTVVKLVALAALLGLCGIGFASLVGELFLVSVFGPGFGQHADAFVWVMAAGALHFVLGALMHAINAAQQRRAQPWIYLGALGTALGVGWLRIPARGLHGAGEAAALGWCVAVALAAFVLVRAMGKSRTSA